MVRCLNTDLIDKESVIQQKILRFLKSKGFLAWKNASGSYSRRYFSQKLGIWKETFVRFGSVGMPDIYAILPDKKGKMIAIEVKRVSGYLSPAQRGVIEVLKRHGVPCKVATCVDDVQEFIKLICEPNP